MSHARQARGGVHSIFGTPQAPPWHFGSAHPARCNRDPLPLPGTHTHGCKRFEAGAPQERTGDASQVVRRLGNLRKPSGAVPPLSWNLRDCSSFERQRRPCQRMAKWPVARIQTPLLQLGTQLSRVNCSARVSRAVTAWAVANPQQERRGHGVALRREPGVRSPGPGRCTWPAGQCTFGRRNRCEHYRTDGSSSELDSTTKGCLLHCCHGGMAASMSGTARKRADCPCASACGRG